MREGDAALGGLALVKRRLQAELEGKRATPSMRLLNALLEMMQPEPGLHIEEQEEVGSGFTILMALTYNLPAHSACLGRCRSRCLRKTA